MKKYLFVCLALILLAALCSGCEKTNQNPDKSAKPQLDNEKGAIQYNTPEVNWGITLTAKNVTDSGLTIVCSQSGGTAEGDLETGSPYYLDVWEDQQWKAVNLLSQEYEVAWTMEAWGIPKNETVEWQVDWQFLYGKLPAGQYRIGKSIMDFKGTGEYDTHMFYAYFGLPEESL